jgi:hypothetical protein
MFSAGLWGMPLSAVRNGMTAAGKVFARARGGLASTEERSQTDQREYGHDDREVFAHDTISLCLL